MTATMKWQKLKVLPGWEPYPDSPPRVRRWADGTIEMDGLAVAKPKTPLDTPCAWLPEGLRPDFKGQDKLVIRYFTTGGVYNDVDIPPTYGPRITFFENGNVMIEENPVPTQPIW